MAAVVFLAALLAASGAVDDGVGGLFAANNHVDGGIAGTRMLARENTDAVTIVGTDDGTTFWTLRGSVADASASPTTDSMLRLR